MPEHETHHSVRLGRLAVVCLLGVILLGGTGAAGGATGPAGEIAYVCEQANRAGLCVINANGTAARSLVKSRSGEIQGPAWSPDGRKVAFAHRISPALWSLDVLDLRSRREHQVATSPIVAWNPTWSPDGRKLAFEMAVETPAAVDLEGIYVVNLNGSSLRRLTPRDVNAVSPSWSPDGKRITYTRIGRPTRNGRGVISMWLTNPSGRAQRELARNVGGRPAWSPDGRWIAFVNGRAQISIMRPDGTHRSDLMKTRWANDRPAWSPDGKWIAFDRCITDRFLCEQVWLVRVDSKEAHRLTMPRPGWANLDPTWRAVGR